MLISLLLAALPAVTAGTISARQDNSICNEQCMAGYRAALAREMALWSNSDIANDPFYETPANATGARPGDLIRWQDVPSSVIGTNWTGIPGGMSLSRMIYMTEDIDRKPIPASAFILLPISSATVDDPQGKAAFKTLAWAHGTTGNARQCAPSFERNLAYGWEAPLFFAANGYAVIATDYSGMGAKSSAAAFQYEAGSIHAADIAYSLVAARKIIGHLLTDEWAVLGHSEGGMTAWRTNERLAMPGQEELLKAGKFLGAVSVAPALRPAELIPKSIELAGPTGRLGAVVSVYLLQSLARLQPENFRLQDILTDGALALLPLLDRGCLNSGQALFAGLTVSQIFKSTSWLTSPAFLDWQTRINGAGPHALAAPMLVVQGLSDTLTYPENCIKDFDRTCAAFPTSSAELYLVPELDHDPAFYASQPYYRSWVDRLFAGTLNPQKACTKSTVKPVNNHFQKAFNG
ncbi:hypothetical protein MN608_11862 [Microdochium nivale]|nr:hypothetical protein MN608_11862 [Microdochium nivale]